MTMAEPQAESKRKVLLYPGEDSYSNRHKG